MFKFNKKETKSNSKKSLAMGASSLADIIAPDGYKITDDHVQVGSGRWVRSMCITQTPNKARIGWLDRLYSVGDVDISMHLEKGNENEVIEALNKEIVELETQIEQARRRHDTTQLSRMRKAHEKAWKLREAIQLGENAMYFATFSVNVAANSKKELDEKCRKLEERLAGRGVHIREAFLQQRDAYRATLPYGINFLQESFLKNLDLGATAAVFPFIRADLSHEYGIYLGTNMQTKGPVFLDTFLPPPYISNNHINVFAKSGAGKTTLIMILITRSLPFGVKNVVLDWKGEYGQVIKELGIGVNIVLSQSGDRHILNLFELSEDIGETGNRALYLNEHVATIKGLIDAIMSRIHKVELTIEEKVILEEAIKQEYNDLSIYEGDPDSLYITASEKTGEDTFIGGKRKKEMPTISSLYKRLQKNERANRLCNCLSEFRRGYSYGLFDGQSTVDLKDKPIINIDMSRLEQFKVRPMANQVILQWVWQEFVKRDRETLKRLIAEEAWSYLEHMETALFLAKMAKAARSYTCALVTSSQDFKQFAEHPIGSAVVTSASINILGLQESVDLKYIYEKYQLSEGEKSVINRFKPGEMLIRIENMGSTLVKIERAEFEKRYMKTSYLEENSALRGSA